VARPLLNNMRNTHTACRIILNAVVTLQKPSLEVAPTTLWLMLLIYSFKFGSGFLPRRQANRRCGVPGFHSHFPPVTLNFDS